MKRKFTKRQFYLLLILLFLTVHANAWSQTVKGIVSDSVGSPLAGASIVIKGTTNGTTTDANGSYSLSIPEASSSDVTLVYSFIGFTPFEVVFSGQTQINVNLKEDNKT